MSDLVAFLTARLDEEEAAAREEGWCPECGSWGIAHACPGPSASWAAGQLPVLHPARMVREVEAKRRIIAIHHAHRDEQYPYCEQCVKMAGMDDPDLGDWFVDWPCPTLRALTAVYSDHPDYDPAWRTDAG